MNIALMVDDRIEMSIEELCEYYGVDYVPASSRQIHGLSHNAVAQAVKQPDILVFVMAH